MTPLSDALTAAQRRALASLEKAYVGGVVEIEDVASRLSECGMDDVVDRAHLFACLDVLREWGAPVPAETNGKPADEPASPKQVQLINDLIDRKQLARPFLDGLTKPQASDLINELQAGTYDPAKWSVPF